MISKKMGKLLALVSALAIWGLGTPAMSLPSQTCRVIKKCGKIKKIAKKCADRCKAKADFHFRNTCTKLYLMCTYRVAGGMQKCLKKARFFCRRAPSDQYGACYSHFQQVCNDIRLKSLSKCAPYKIGGLRYKKCKQRFSALSLQCIGKKCAMRVKGQRLCKVKKRRICNKTCVGSRCHTTCVRRCPKPNQISNSQCSKCQAP